MKRLIFVSACAIALAIAQNLVAGPEALPSGKEMKEIAPAPPPECNWTGFYIGAFGGYSWGDFRVRDEDEPLDDSYHFHQDGFVGGGEGGANLQLGAFVMGFEVTFAGGDWSDSASIETPGGVLIGDGHVDSNWLGTAAGRIGISFFHDHVLLFGKGGAGWSSWKYRSNEVLDLETGRVNDDVRTGALVGGGIEFAFNCHVSIKVEYDHVFFGDDDEDVIERGPGGFMARTTFNAHDADRDLVVAGLNFKF